MSSTAAESAMSGEAWEAALAESHAVCREVSRMRARNFYYGMKLTPEPRRSAMFALYAWNREVDDLADEAGDVEAKTEALDRFRKDTDRAIDPTLDDVSQLPKGKIWPAVREMVLRYNLPTEYLYDMVAGQLIDQTKTRYTTFEELYDYCYKVASLVGLSCVEIWGYDGGAETRQLAEWRGIAFQLTNILRDVLEDAERDRVYLPAEDFNVYELNPSMFTLKVHDDALKGIARVAQRAREYYEKSAPLDARVHGCGRACLWAMTEIYRRILDKIERDPAIVLSGQRVRLGSARKGMIALRASVGSVIGFPSANGGARG
ncbi:MAG: phytoene/squalene synthase family protein [Phycisphaera sp.]|nr:phytoene/squalene synthase family protein [Phycisphaera sp.]